MKNIKYLAYSILLILLGCGSDDSMEIIENPTIEYSINSMSPLGAKIGDTIRISGTNLSKLDSLYILHEDRAYHNDTITIQSYSFISITDEEISFKIPPLYHENILIELNSSNSLKLDLVGFIPVLNNITVKHSQILTDEIAYLSDGEKIYKSVDGYYTWDEIYTIENGYNISCFYFLDESHCWIGVQGSSVSSEGVTIHYSENGGTDFDLKFLVNQFSSGNQINNIKFTSLSKGFFVDNNQEMYISDNSSFENIYDYYPDLNSLPFGKIEIWGFCAVNDNLIFLAPNGDPYLIKIDNQNITYSEFDLWPLPPKIFGNIGYVQVNSDIYKTIDLGNSWTKIKTFDNYYPQLHFFDKDVGFAMVNYTPEVFYKTIDGGDSWVDFWTPPYSYNNPQPIIPTKHTWLFGDLWKYIEE